MHVAGRMAAVMAGVLRGARRQKIGVVTTSFAFWIVGLPLGGVLNLHAGMGAKGMW